MAHSGFVGATGPRATASAPSWTSSADRKRKQVIKDITEAQTWKSRGRPWSYWGLRSDQSVFEPPSKFDGLLEDQLNEEKITQAAYDYYKRIRRADDQYRLREPPSLVIQMLREDAIERAKGKRLLKWMETQDHIQLSSFPNIRIWSINPADGSAPLRVVIKTEKKERFGLFFQDYLREAEFTRRLNLAGCNEIITVIDWAVFGDDYKICYEWAEFGDLHDVASWHFLRDLILPECFIWHVFKCLASALAYCQDGTNTGHHIRRWEETVHADLKEANIFLFPPVVTENQHYPYVKLADFGTAFTAPDQDVRSFNATRATEVGTPGYRPPEIHEAQKLGHSGALRNFPTKAIPAAHSDVWTMGLLIRRMISLINKWVPEGLYQRLVEKKLKRPFYSPALNRLVERCMSMDSSMRPKASEIYKIACHFHDVHYAKLNSREVHARSHDSSVYLGQVLFSRADQIKYDKHWNHRDKTFWGFAKDYREVNFGPLRDWLGITRQKWRELDPDDQAPAEGAEYADRFLIPLEKKENDEVENTRLILQDEEHRRWVRDYYEAAGHLVPPRPRPEFLPTPTSATMKIMNATFQDAPVPRQNSIDEANIYFHETRYSTSLRSWKTADFLREEYKTGSDDFYNGGTGDYSSGGSEGGGLGPRGPGGRGPGGRSPGGGDPDGRGPGGGGYNTGSNNHGGHRSHSNNLSTGSGNSDDGTSKPVQKAGKVYDPNNSNEAFEPGSGAPPTTRFAANVQAHILQQVDELGDELGAKWQANPRNDTYLR